MNAIQKMETEELLRSIQNELSEMRATLELVALSMTIGQNVRLLGGHVTEADVRRAAEQRLRQIVEASES